MARRSAANAYVSSRSTILRNQGTAMKRGRVSAAELSVIDIDVQQARLTPPAYLWRPELELFSSIVDVCDAEHFRNTDLPLLDPPKKICILAKFVRCGR